MRYIKDSDLNDEDLTLFKTPAKLPQMTAKPFTDLLLTHGINPPETEEFNG